MKSVLSKINASFCMFLNGGCLAWFTSIMVGLPNFSFAQQSIGTDEIIVNLKLGVPNSLSFKEVLTDFYFLREKIRTDARSNSFLFDKDPVKSKFYLELQTISPQDTGKLRELLSAQFVNVDELIESFNKVYQSEIKFIGEFPQISTLTEVQTEDVILYSILSLENSQVSYINSDSNQNISAAAETRAECIEGCENGYKTDVNVCEVYAVAGIAGCAAAFVAGSIACPPCIPALAALDVACTAGFVAGEKGCERTAEVTRSSCEKGCPATNKSAPANLILESVCKSDHTLLTWQVEDGLIPNSFLIESSSDGIRWQDIALIDTITNKITPNIFSFQDVNSSSQTNFYRIIAMQSSGNKTYSSILSTPCKSIEQISVRPNPVQNVASINIPSLKPQRIPIGIYDSKGILIKSFQKNLHVGSNQLEVDLNGRAAGVYSIIANFGNSVKVVKLMKY